MTAEEERAYASVEGCENARAALGITGGGGAAEGRAVMNPHRNVQPSTTSSPPAPSASWSSSVTIWSSQAASGDARALSAVVVTFLGKAPRGIARRELGERWEEDAQDVVQEIYAAMALGTLASAASALELGEGLPWLKRLVREQ